MLIASTLNNESNGYSLVNKNFLNLFGQSCVKCAVADISSPSKNSSYRVTHNLGTRNVVVSIYDVSTSYASVEAGYTVPDENNVIINLDNFDNSKVSTIKVVVMGAITYTTATASKITNN